MKKTQEHPLYYWEEKSYMMVIPPHEEDNLLSEALSNIGSMEETKIIENNYDVENKCIHLKIDYEGDFYDIGLFEGGISVPEYYLNSPFFKDDEKEKILKAKKAITIFMPFLNEPKKSYHLQLKLCVAMVPNLIGLLDESAEKMLSSHWVKMAANSKVLPSSKNLFSVQGVIGDDDKVWLHTHGLCRCGLTELEILDSDMKNQQNHYNLLNTYAMYLVDRKEKTDPRGKGSYIGRLINGYPVVVTCIPWIEGLKEYKRIDLGGPKDRQEGHNSQTSIVFLYKSEKDENKRKLSKISDYDELWGDNPLFFFSDEETDRMKALAREQFDYVKKASKDKDNTILLKIGLPLQEEGKYEHIWFELLEIKGEKFKAKLTQEPYYFNNIHAGYEAWYQKDDITDWIIYTESSSITPDTAFLLDK
ncbi:MAG TPA: DUF4026 domain-containing protein [Firmicutes bacterium]|nr:DUF4026 domain-containing protein [Bacillota bacterium]